MKSTEVLPYLQELLECVTLEVVGVGLRAPQSYAGHPTPVLIRMHLLPYVLPLKSERSLAFEVSERPELQVAVGVKENQVPSRATLWHFRHRHAEVFRRLMWRSLAVLALWADGRNAVLPFMRDDTDHHDGFDAVERDSVIDRPTGICLSISAKADSRPYLRKDMHPTLFPPRVSTED